MAVVDLVDEDGLLGNPSTSFDLDFERALLLLAIATSPSPTSRYLTNPLWAQLRYAHVYDPRTRASNLDLIINPGIADLDPHQKAVLSDDMGVGLALALIDQGFGILGLDDIYALHSQNALSLASGSGHRVMPDFALWLAEPVGGSRLILLECKGTQTASYRNTQLTRGCEQLSNVSGVCNIAAADIPRIVVGTYLNLGHRASLRVSDPPDEVALESGLVDRLVANYLALELVSVGDLASANKVWTQFGLPQVDLPAGIEPSKVPVRTVTRTTDELLKPKRVRREAASRFETLSRDRSTFVRTQIDVAISPSAAEVQEEDGIVDLEKRTAAIAEPGSREVSGTVTIQEDDKNAERLIDVHSKTALGAEIKLRSSLRIQS